MLSTPSITPPSHPQTKRKRDSDVTAPVGLLDIETTPLPVPTPPRKRIHLRVEIPVLSLMPSDDDSPSSLFSALSDPDSLFDELSATSPSRELLQLPPPARLTPPPIQGLFFTPSLLLPQELADNVVQYCLDTYFQNREVNQVMLFGRFSPPQIPASCGTSTQTLSGLPPVLLSLLSTIDTLLQPGIPPATHALLFPPVPTQARQAIINLYQPGEGISSHVDLLKRFGDGIIGVSLGSGCVMRFDRADEEKPETMKPKYPGDITEDGRCDLYLPERSILVLSEDARYGWTHGIEKRQEDYVSADDGPGTPPGKWIKRRVRLSVTFRWLLPGADVVGKTDAEHAEVA